MRPKVVSLVGLVSILAVSAVSATNAAEVATGPDGVRLTLDEAVERAIRVAPALRSLDAEVSAAEAEVRVARANRRPQIDLSAGYARWSNIPEFQVVDATGTLQTIYPNIPDNWTSHLGLAFPLYAGGGLSSKEQAAKNESAAARDDLRTGEADLVLEVTRAYWSLVTARADERVLSEVLRSYDAHLVDARNRERVGLAARNEVLAVQVDRDRAELGRIRATNAAAVARADLARLLDFPPETLIEPTEELEPVGIVAGDVDSLVNQALSTRPERAAMQRQIAAAEARVGAEHSARLPRVFLTANWDYANPNRRIIPPTATWEETWDVGVMLNFRLYDGGRATASTARAEFRVEALRGRLADLDNRIRLQVTSALLDLDSARAAMPVSERGVESGRENLRVTRERYREGVTPSSELLDAESALLRAELDRTRTLVFVQLALANLDRAVGRSTWDTP